jgi:GTP-binding protein
MQQFIDEARIYIKAGNGGNGAVSFRREKFIDRGGPDGGDGGRGGSVIFKTNPHMNTLVQFRFKREFIADDGENGHGRNKTGKSRDALVIEVPVGTQIFTQEGMLLIADLDQETQEFEIVKGGKGGLGNVHFKSSVNQAPRRRTDGEIGEEMDLVLKLKLLSDAGLVGLPNAGKSTFLASTTSATPKIANYPFTTLKPNLGVVRINEEDFVLADIPGLIEGAHEGSGLGDRFLKHIERCGVLLHVIDSTADDIAKDYVIIRNELESYSPLLKDKPEIICLNKIDSITAEELQDKINELGKVTRSTIYPISTYGKQGLDIVLKKTLETIQKWRQGERD